MTTAVVAVQVLRSVSLLAEGIVETHEMWGDDMRGAASQHSHGTGADPWSREFALLCTGTMVASAPSAVLRGIASSFDATLCEIKRLPDSRGRSVVSAFLRNVSDALRTAPQLGPEAEAEGIRAYHGIPRAIPIVPLAEGSTVSGARALLEACNEVSADLADPVSIHLLSADERAILVRISSEWTIAQVAADLGYSERSLYRRLKLIRSKLGARSRQEVVLEATRRGLIER